MIVPAGRSGFDTAPSPLVGRERELAVLRERLGAALAGRGSLVLVGGEAGIGKTTLAEAALREASEGGAVVLVGRCYDLSETPPYGPWRELLGRAPRDGALPVLPVATLPPDAGGEALMSQEAIFARVGAYFGALVARQPVVVLLDDLHWADPASLDLLRTLARGLGELSLLLLATYRVDELTRRHPLYQLLPLLVRETRATRLDVRPLDDAGLLALVRGQGRLRPADEARLVGYLRERAEGNPFFAGELLRALAEAGVLRAGQDGGDSALGALGEARVPPLLRQVIDARVDRLGEGARQLLAVASVVGQAVRVEVWQAVSEASEAELLDCIERAGEVGLVAETGEGVRFAHALIREALYEGLTGIRRRAIHRRVAEALSAGRNADPDAVAYHFRQAGDGRAAEWLARAGERATRAYAWVTATERYEAALALLEQQEADSCTRARLLHILGLLCRYTDPIRTLALLDEALTLAGACDDPVIAAAIRFDRGHHLCLGDIYGYGEGLPDIRSALPFLEDLTPEQFGELPTALVLGARHGEGYHRGVLLLSLSATGHLAEAASAEATTLESGPGTSFRAHFAMGGLHMMRGEPALAVQVLTAGVAAAQAAGQHREALIIQVGIMVVIFRYRTDDLAAWKTLTDEMMASIPVAGAADEAFDATEIFLLWRWIRGEWDDLTRWAEEHPTRQPWFTAMLARHRGDVGVAWERVHAVLPDGLATVPGTRYHGYGLFVQAVAADLALGEGDLPTARAWLGAQNRWLDWSGAVMGQVDAALGWAGYHRAAGDLTRAREHADRAIVLAGEPRQPLMLIAAHRLLSELDTLDGRYAAALAHLRVALDLAEACAVPYERALCLLALAELREAERSVEAARGMLAEAQSILAKLGAKPALARAEAIATHLDAHPVAQAAAPTRPFGLSTREAEVLQLVAQGLSNVSIADRLSLSHRTIEQHLRSICNKLGVENRAAATRIAVEQKLV